MDNLPVKNLLITGCGGDIAIAMARIIRDILPHTRLLGTDIHEDHPAQAFFDHISQIARADDPAYPAALQSIIREQDVQLVIPSTEAEIGLFVNQPNAEEFFGAPLLLASSSIVKTALDKYETAQFLKSIGVLSPWTIPVGTGQPKELPCMIKPRSGCGSKNIAIVQSGALAQYADYGSDYIWQEYLQPDDEEYTCGLFRSRGGEIRSLVIKRQLQGGLTGKGVVVEDHRINQLLETLARQSGLTGSINAQLRLTSAGPVIFEINPRFSSTVMFRHKMGFQDLLWALQDKFELPLSDYTAPAPGTRLYRVSREVIFNP